MAERQKYLLELPLATEIAMAAKQAIRAVKADHPSVDDIDIAALIGADSAKTIERLEKMETQKVPASLFVAIARKWGEQYTKAYRDLFEDTTDAIEASKALPAITALAAKIATAMQGGKRSIDHQALAGMLTELRDVDAAVAALRARASELGMAA